MPGIHVRSVSKLDWVERGNEPVLTVPGAYWLCHKKQIYKFTFKWNKTKRDTDEFAYPKELTKVIRRIIKSQPRQGQQFGTRHLLVTYNHSSWLRQDKMFAMLKFRDRTDATAFPHAFVLTVKTVKETSVDEATVNYQKDLSSEIKRREKNDTEDEKNRRLQGSRKDKEIEDETRDSSGNFAKPHDQRRPTRKRKLLNEEKSSENPVSCSTTSEIEWQKDPGKRTASKAFNFDDTDSIPGAKRRKQRQLRSAHKCRDKIPGDFQSEEGTAGDTADLPYQYLIEKEIEDSKCARENVEIDSPTPQQQQQETELNSGCRFSNKDVDSSGKNVLKSPKACQQNDNATRSADITDLVMEGLMFTIRQDQDSVTVVEQKTKLEMDEVLENSEKAETKEGEKCLLNSSLLRLESLITKIEMSGSESKMKNRMKIDGNENLVKIIDDEDDISLGCSNEPPVAETPKLPLVKIDLNNIRGVLDSKLQFNVNTVDSGEEEDENVDLDGAENENLDFDGAENEKKGEKRGEICVIGNEEKKEEVREEEDEKADEKEEKEDEEEEEEEEVGLTLKYEDPESEIADQEILDEENKDSFACKESQSSESQKIDKKMEESSENLSKDVEKIIANDSVEGKIVTMDSCGSPRLRTPRVVSNERFTYDKMPLALQRALRHKLITKSAYGVDSEKNVSKELDEDEKEEFSRESREESEEERVKEGSEGSLEDLLGKEEILEKEEPVLEKKKLVSEKEELSRKEEPLPLNEKPLPPNEEPIPPNKAFLPEKEDFPPPEKPLAQSQDLPDAEEPLPHQQEPLSQPEKLPQPEKPLPQPPKPLPQPQQNEPTSQTEKIPPATQNLMKTKIAATIDVTEDFERELSNRKPSEQRIKRKSLRNTNQSSLNTGNSNNASEIRIDMWKFMQDMTRGARVVIHRLDLTNIQSGIGTTNNTLLTRYASRRCAAESK